MSANDSFVEPGSILGNVDLPVLTFPTIRGTVRRSDPDGGHNQPYFPGLIGTSLTVGYGVVGAAPTAVTINFASNNYADVVAAVNAASPANIRWVEADGFACIQSLHGGGKNLLVIQSGTAAAVLGLPVSPYPGSTSRAGDIAPGAADKRQKNPQTSKLIGHDEILTSQAINRAILGGVEGIIQKLDDLDKEFITYKVFNWVQYSVSGAVPSNTFRLTGAPTDKFSVDTYLRVLSQDMMEVMDGSYHPLYDASGNQCIVNAVSYGSGEIGSAPGPITWGTPPVGGTGVDIGSSAAYRSFKVAATVISSMPTANIIVAAGATFVTKGVQVGDHVQITGATNNTPFNHNGEFAIVQVVNETTLVVRPLGPNGTLVDPANDTPRSLNPDLSGGGAYGSVAVYIGLGFPLHGPTGSNDDALMFATSMTLSVGQTGKFRVAVKKTLRQMLAEELSPQSIDPAAHQDPQIARQNKANIFAFLNTFLQGIKLSSPTPDGVTQLQVPRIQADLNDGNTDIEYAEMWSTAGLAGSSYKLRMYVKKTSGHLIFTFNAKWNPLTTNWVQDNAAVDSYRMDFSQTGTQHMRIAAGATVSNDAWQQLYAESNGGLTLAPITQAIAAISTNSGAFGANTRLLLTDDLNFFGTHFRLYISSNGLELAFKCTWNSGTQLWVTDDTNPPGLGGGTLIRIAAGRLRVLTKGSGPNTWQDTDPDLGVDGGGAGWDHDYFDVINGRITGGNGLTLGTELLGSIASALTARLKTQYNTVDANRGLTFIWESSYFPSSSISPTFRLYVGKTNKEIRFTVNCAWDGTNWTKDVTADAASSYSFSESGFQTYTRFAASVGSWNDSSWDSTTFAVSGTSNTASTKGLTALDTPQYVAKDPAGSNRGGFDHIGFPAGRNSEFREDWYASPTVDMTVSGLLTNNPRWTATITNTKISPGFKPELFQSPYVAPSFIGGGPGNLTLQSTKPLFGTTPSAGLLNSNFSAVLEFEIAMLATDATTVWTFGVDTNPGNTQTAGLYFQSTNNGVWQAFAKGVGGASALSPTVINPTDLAPHRFRIEYHGSGTVYGATTMRFFADDSLIATLAANVPATSSGLYAFINGTTAGGSSGSIAMGPFRFIVNRWATPVLL